MTSTMKAVVQDRYGPPEVLELREVDRPAPAEGEVLVRVRAAGVDRGVWHVMAGRPYLVRVMGFGLRAPKLPVRGNDVAGRVEAAGEGVTRFGPGDEVFGACEGSFAGYACAPEDRLAAKPESLSFEEAAALPVSGITALQGLRDAGEVAAGQKVLVLGASGGVGSYAVQIARAFGARVTGVASTAKMELVRSLGAERVIDYTREEITDRGERWDLILDVGGNRSLHRLRRALAPRGTLVIVGGEGGGRWLGGTDRQLRALLLSPFLRQTLRPFLARITREDLEALKGLVEAGKVRPVVDRTYPLAEAPAAVRYLVEGRARGKVVLTV